jgi:hypothetical protein
MLHPPPHPHLHGHEAPQQLLGVGGQQARLARDHPYDVDVVLPAQHLVQRHQLLRHGADLAEGR